MKDSFILHTKFYQPLSILSDEQFGKLMRLIFLYHMDKPIEPPSDLMIAWEFLKVQFEYDERKYQDIIERNKSNGKKGGRPKTQPNPINPVGFSETQPNPTKPKKADNDNDNDIINLNLTSNEVKLCRNVVGNIPDETENGKDSVDEVRSEAVKSGIRNSNICEEIKTFYNDCIAKYNSLLPRCYNISKDRKTSVLARINEYGIDDVKACIENAASSRFLSDGTFHCDLSWIMRPNNFIKVLEGKYNDKSRPTGIAPPPEEPQEITVTHPQSFKIEDWIGICRMVNRGNAAPAVRQEYEKGLKEIQANKVLTSKTKQ